MLTPWCCAACCGQSKADASGFGARAATACIKCWPTAVPTRGGFNGDYERPTFWPSVLVTGVVPLTEQQWSDYQQGKGLPKPVKSVCHSFVTDGRVQFLADCTHALRGTTVELTAPPAHEASSD